MPKKLCLIAAEFHQGIMAAMLAQAQTAAQELEAEIVDIITVPGAVEIPFACQTALDSGKYDALAVLGFIEKGETLHGEVMGHQVLCKIMDLQLAHGRPIGYGIIGPGATETQAKARTADSASGAIQAAVRMLELKEQFNNEL